MTKFQEDPSLKQHYPPVAGLMLTYNRLPRHRYLLEEAIESWRRQTYQGPRRLFVVNDTPGQQLEVVEWSGSHNDRVEVWNLAGRFATLSKKVQYAIDAALAWRRNAWLMRWDDDDISLPWRVSLSVERLRQRRSAGISQEWRPDNHWYTPGGKIEGETVSPGNTHNMAIFTREALDRIGGYPKGWCSGEDQAFNRAISEAGWPGGDRLTPEEIFYLYRWGHGQHLSAELGDPQEAWDRLGERSVARGRFEIQPRWHADYERLAREAVEAYSR